MVFSDDALAIVSDWIDRKGNPGCRPEDAVAVMVRHPVHGWALLALDEDQRTHH